MLDPAMPDFTTDALPLQSGGAAPTPTGTREHAAGLAEQSTFGLPLGGINTVATTGVGGKPPPTSVLIKLGPQKADTA